MNFDLGDFILQNLEAAGAIGAYVSISIIGVALLMYASKRKIENKNHFRSRYLQPVLGALLGVIPGCGGTIIASSMYKKDKLTFGGLFAAFITTLGEGSFVLLGASAEADVSSNLKAFAIVNLVGFFVGLIFGYVVDAIGYKINLEKPKNNGSQALKNHDSSISLPTINIIEKFGFYIILAMSVFLLPGSIMALWGGGIEALESITIWITILFTLTCFVYYLIYKYSYKSHSTLNKGLKLSLLSAVIDIAMVTVYVFIGLFIANFLIDIVVGPEAFDAWMTSSAFAVVLISALIGVTPGCGGMIAVAVAYITIDNFPIAALIAAAIATSGDGIFPLLAANKRDAIIISISGLLIALIIGLLILIFSS